MPVIRRVLASRFSLRLHLAMEELLAHALGRKLAAMRESGLSLNAAFARIEELERRNALAERWLEIYRGRIAKLAAVRRTWWWPEARFEILELKRAERLTAEEAARRACVCASTIHAWEAESRRHPERKTVGSLLRPHPPIRRISDSVRRIVLEVDRLGVLGSVAIAQHLARVAIRVSPTSVARIRRERPPCAPPARRARALVRVDRPVRARRPRQIYLADLTSIPGWLRLFDFRLGAVIDARSRLPLVARIFLKEPSGAEIRHLLRKTFRRFGAPETFLSDRGAAFVSKKVRKYLRREGVEPRLGAVGQSGSIALIERTWRTLKLARGFLLKRLEPLVADDLGRKLEASLTYYAHHRPHQGLGGATPAEVFFGRRPAHLDAVPAPRGRPGENDEPLPVEIRFHAGHRGFPYLARTDGRAKAA